MQSINFLIKEIIEQFLSNCHKLQDFLSLKQLKSKVLCHWKRAQIINWKCAAVHPPLPADIFYLTKQKAGAAE